MSECVICGKDTETKEFFSMEFCYSCWCEHFNIPKNRDGFLPDNKEILQKAITHYGEPAQVLKAIEELCELGIEISGTLQADNPYFRQDMVTLVRCLSRAVVLCKYDIPSTTSEMMILPPTEERCGDIAKETADVRIMLQQLEMFIVKPDEVQEQIDFKVKRLEERMKGESK